MQTSKCHHHLSFSKGKKKKKKRGGRKGSFHRGIQKMKMLMALGNDVIIQPSFKAREFCEIPKL
jgi:hypothetical protein